MRDVNDYMMKGNLAPGKWAAEYFFGLLNIVDDIDAKNCTVVRVNVPAMIAKE